MAKLTVGFVVRGITEIFTDYEEGSRSEPIEELLEQAKAAKLDFKKIAAGLKKEMETDYGWQIEDAYTIADCLKPYGIMKFSVTISVDSD